MSKVRFHTERAAGFSAGIVALVALLIINMTMASGLIEGLNPGADTKQGELINRETMKVTVEGAFVDRNGDAITEADEPGEIAKLKFDECYSYLIGYRSANNNLGGLRRLLMQFLYFGGTDGVGSRIGLTTDNGLQEYCYNALGAHEGSVIVMDAHTGELLAITSRSSAEMGYDADKYSEKFTEYNSYHAFWYDRANYTEDPPGSTFKIITSAAMLENDMGDYIYDDIDGSYEIPGGGVVHNVKNGIYGPGINMEKALNDSINVYFASAAVEMTAPRLERMLSKFRFNEDIVTDFCRIRSTYDEEIFSRKGELAQIGFGQGSLAMSPLHVAMIMGTVLNDGIMPVPYVIREIYDDGEDRIDEFHGEAGAHESYDVFSAETADILKEYLHSTAEGYGFTEEKYGMVYAKTGTADQFNGLNHVYMLMGVETEQRDYVILINAANVSRTSSLLKESGAAILEYVLSM